MLTTLLIIAMSWALLSLCGWLLLGVLDKKPRDMLLPAAPLFGVVLLVPVLHGTTLVLPVRYGVVVVAGVLLALAGAATSRDRGWWRPTRSALAVLAITASLGAVPAAWALGPTLAVGDSSVVQPSPNNDAFYYVTVADWLQDHPATTLPQISSTPEGPGVPPSYGAARAQLTLHLRLGQELVHAALSTTIGRQVADTWYPLTALWVMLMPAAGVAVARLLRLRLLTGLLLGTATSVSALVMNQLAYQNSDSLLGIALVPLALGAVLSTIGRRRLVPPVLAGLILSALVGTYTEFLPIIAPALVVAVLARAPRELRHVVPRAVTVVGWAVLLAPLIWWRAVQSLITLGAISTDDFPSSFASAPVSLILGRFVGAAGPEDVSVSTPTLTAILLFIGVGLVGALVLSGRRWFFLAVLGIGLFLATYLVTVRDRPYTQQRVVQLMLPLVLLIVAVGWDRLQQAVEAQRHLHGKRRAPGPSVGAAIVTLVALVGAGVLMTANGVVDHALGLPAVAETRHVGPEFDEAADWVEEVGGSDGKDVAVLVGDFFSQLWLTDALREDQDVSYVSLYPSYQYQSSYWNGEPRRWVIADASSIRRLDPGVVVRRNSRFLLLDFSRGRAAVAARADVYGQNSFVVLRSASTSREIRLVGTLRSRTPTDVPLQAGYGDPVAPRPLADGQAVVTLDLADELAQRVVLSDDDEVFDPTGVRFGPKAR